MEELVNIRKSHWSASKQLGFLIAYVLFEVFFYLFTVSPVSKSNSDEVIIIIIIITIIIIIAL